MSTQLPHEIVDSRLDILEAENARFDERVAESIKRLSESGQIVSSSGNAINVKGAPDESSQSVENCGIKDSKFEEAWTLRVEKERAAKAEFFGAGEAVGGSAGGFVNFAGHGSSSTDLTREEWLNALRAGHFSEGMPKLEPDEELPHTLPPHIAGVVDECKRLRVERAKLLSEIKSSSVGNYLRLANLVTTATNELNNVESCLVEVVIEHFGGES